MIDIINIFVVIIGFCSSLLGSILGLGGGFINVPALIFLGYPENATAISLFAVLFNGINASIFNIRKELVDFKIATFYIPSAIIGGIFGVFAFNFIASIDINIFKLIFTFFLIFLALKIFLKRDEEEAEDKKIKIEEFDKRDIAYEILIGLAAGIAGSFFGIGGGSIAVPAFIFVFGVSTHVAVATSLFVMIFSSISGLITYFSQGNLPNFALLFGILLVIGVIIGSNIGSRLAYKFKGKKIRKLYGIFSICIAIPLTWLRILIPITDPVQIFIENLEILLSNLPI